MNDDFKMTNVECPLTNLGILPFYFVESSGGVYPRQLRLDDLLVGGDKPRRYVINRRQRVSIADWGLRNADLNE